MIIKDFYKSVKMHRKYSKILKKIYKDENIIENLSALFGVRFKIDKIGRIYAVINPNIAGDKYSATTQIFEYNENGLDNTTYVEKWIMERMNIASRFIRANNLFDLLTYKIERIDEYDNFLFVMQPITLHEAIKNIKRFSILTMSLVFITGVLMLVL